MADKKIRGITVEIGGDVTKLDKALGESEKQSNALQRELREIDKLLKFDPTNTELLTQKQSALTDSISETTKKLDTLKEAEAQVIAQFERGEIAEDQLRAFQREIIQTEKNIKSYEEKLESTTNELKQLSNTTQSTGDDIQDSGKDADKTADSLDDLADSADKAGESSEGLGSKLGGVLKGGLTAITGTIAGMTTALIGTSEATRQYRTDMGKLDTAFTTAGHTSETARTTYEALQGVLGESDQAVEASNHLAKLCENEEELATWTDIATGVYAQFGASLPIENLTEASNETAKTGQITGGLADALNWASESEEAFQSKLDACSTEQERQALITETLNGLYAESAEKYRETNAEVIRANEANESLNQSLAEIGGTVEPLLTDVKMLGASLLADLVPSIKSVTEAFRGVMNGDEGATADLGTALSGIITSLLTKITELAPTLATVGINLITTLITSIIVSIPQLITTGIDMIMAIINGLTSAIPLITTALVTMIPQLASALTTGIPQLIQGAVSLFLAILQAIPQIIPPLISALPTVVMAIVNGLLTAIPQLIQGAIQFLLAIVQAIPELIAVLVPKIPEIVTAIILGLLDNIPVLLDGAVMLLSAIVQAIPLIIVELIKAVPKIVDTIISYMKQLPGKLWAILKSVVSNYITWLSNLRTTAKDGFVKIVSAIVTVAKSIPGKIKSAISGAISVITTWGSNLLTKAKSAVQKVVTGIVDKFKTVVNKVKSIGKNIVEGVWNGINDKVEWIKNKITGFKDAVLNKLKSVFGINSPSRVMRDMVGVHLATGIAEGMTDSDAPTNAIEQVKSDILKGANEINGITLNRQLEHTFTNNMSSGGSVADLVNLVSEYFPKLIEASNKSIYLNGKTLVGETINDIDNALGTIYAMKARGT